MSKYQICFDPAAADPLNDYDTIGSYLLDSNGDALTSTLVGADQALDVNVVQSSGQFAEDSAHTTADIGNHMLSVREDTLASSTSADGDYSSIKSNSTGEVYVTNETGNASLSNIEGDTAAMVIDLAAIEVELLDQGTTLDTISTVISGISQLEDSVHASGDAGVMSLAVRNDAGGSLVSADGDYAPLQVNAAGELRVSAAVTTACPNTSVQNTATAVDDTVGGTDLVGTDLASRDSVWIANEGAKTIYIGGSGVTAATGFPLGRKAFMELCVGANINLHAITSSGTADVRIMEFA